MNSIQGLSLPAIVLVLVLLCSIAHSQLTFSPYWGKRSSANAGGGGSIVGKGLFDPAAIQKADCRNANEMLKDIFRFIQMKAQAFAECNRGQ